MDQALADRDARLRIAARQFVARVGPAGRVNDPAVRERLAKFEAARPKMVAS